MAGRRIRRIRPDWWHDQEVASLTRDARLFALGCVSAADDYGVFRSHPALLRGEVFPYDFSVTAEEIERWMGELIGGGHVQTFQRKGQDYAWFLGWNDHLSPWYQKVDRPSKTHRHPAPPSTPDEPVPAVQDGSDGGGQGGDPTPEKPRFPEKAPPEVITSRAGGIVPEDVLSWFREEAPTLGAPAALTSRRRELVVDFLGELPGYDEPKLRGIFRRMELTPFLRGKGGPGSFAASFTWLTEDADRAVKVESGHYGAPDEDKPEEAPTAACDACKARPAAWGPPGCPSPLVADEALTERRCTPCYEKELAPDA